MPYQSDTIAAVVNRLNVQYFLPAIQRQFVWRPDQIVQLFDSVMRGYPISSFLFWELKPENKDQWQVYRFIDRYSERGTRSDLANTNGVQQLTLVLDGQQRLTSLLIGLKGTYTVKKKYMRWDNPDAWATQILYVDLLHHPGADEEDVEIGMRYDFRFFENPPANTDQHWWFRVGRILDFDSESRFSEFLWEERDRLPGTTTKVQLKTFEQTLSALYRAIWRDAVVAYYTEHDQDYDRVLDIFVRANEGGTKLSKSDLLLSMVTARWDDLNAREEIYGFVEDINSNLTRRNDFDKDFVLKTSLVLCDLPVPYLVKNFNNRNLAHIRREWDGIKRTIRTGIDLVNSFGIDRDTLTSANAVIPILYFLHQRPSTSLRTGSTTDVRNASAVRRWLLMALLNNVFGGSSDKALTDTRRVLSEHRTDQLFPAEAISAELARSGRLTTFNDQAIANLLALTYGGREAFLALTLLYDDNNWGTMSFHQDHIFPQSLFTPRSLESFGFDLDRQWQYRSLMNRIGNLQLLISHENEEKSDKDFGTWLATRDVSFKRRHLIPDDPSLYLFERFEQFIHAREQMIRERLAAIFAPVAAVPSVSAG